MITLTKKRKTAKVKEQEEEFENGLNSAFLISTIDHIDGIDQWSYKNIKKLIELDMDFTATFTSYNKNISLLNSHYKTQLVIEESEVNQDVIENVNNGDIVKAKSIYIELDEDTKFSTTLEIVNRLSKYDKNAYVKFDKMTNAIAVNFDKAYDMVVFNYVNARLENE